MKKLDFYTKMKMDLVMMSLNQQENMIDLVALPLYCPWLINDDNLVESYSRLADMYGENYSSLNEFMSYIKDIDDKGEFFSINDVNDEYEFIKDNMALQAEYYVNMLSYIDFCDDYTNSRVDVEDFCDNYCERDDQIFDQVQVNHSLIKSIREERKRKS